MSGNILHQYSGCMIAQPQSLEGTLIKGVLGNSNHDVRSSSSSCKAQNSNSGCLLSLSTINIQISRLGSAFHTFETITILGKMLRINMAEITKKCPFSSSSFHRITTAPFKLRSVNNYKIITTFIRPLSIRKC